MLLIRTALVVSVALVVVPLLGLPVSGKYGVQFVLCVLLFVAAYRAYARAKQSRDTAARLF